jgi:hypothetical protein
VVLAVGGLVMSVLDRSAEPSSAEPVTTEEVLREDFSGPSGAFDEYRTEGYSCAVPDGAFVVTSTREGHSSPSVTAIPSSDVVDVSTVGWFVSDGGALDAARRRRPWRWSCTAACRASRACSCSRRPRGAVDLSQRAQLRLTAVTTSSDGVALTAYLDGQQELTRTEAGRRGGFAEVGLVVYTDGSVTAAFDDMLVRAALTS